MEKRHGKTFPKAQQEIQEEIVDALDAFECEGYEVKTHAPKEMKASDVAACIAIIKTGHAVNWRSAKDELPRATALAIAWKDDEIVGLGAIKGERRRDCPHRRPRC